MLLLAVSNARHLSACCCWRSRTRVGLPYGATPTGVGSDVSVAPASRVTLYTRAVRRAARGGGIPHEPPTNDHAASATKVPEYETRTNQSIP